MQMDVAMKKIYLSVLGSMTFAAMALPQGFAVNSGDAELTTLANQMTITQSSNSADVNWDSFNIHANESVQFVQPAADSVIFNRIGSASTIAGSLSANGHVYLMNDSGITFTDSATIDVPALFVNTEQLVHNGSITTNKALFEADSMNINGVINTGDSSNAQVHMQGNTIYIGGAIDASNSSTGGEVLVSAAEKLELSGHIKAEGAQGGLIGLASPNKEITGTVSVAGEESGWIYDGANTKYVMTLRNPAAGNRSAGLYHFETLDGKTFINRNLRAPSVFSASEALFFSDENKLELTDAEWQGEEQLPSFSHYYGGDEAIEFNPHYKKIRASDVFPGVDMVYYNNNRGEIEHDLIVAPGSSPDNIIWKIDGAKLENGNIIKGDFKQLAPFTYQDVGTHKRVIESNYIDSAQGFKIEVADYDAALPLVIDPTVPDVTTLAYYQNTAGNSSFTFNNQVYQLGNGDVVFAINTNANNIPTKQGTSNFYNATKGAGFDNVYILFNEDLTEVKYATYLQAANSSQRHILGLDEQFLVAANVTSGLGGLPGGLPASFNKTYSGTASATALLLFDNNGTLANYAYMTNSTEHDPSTAVDVFGDNLWIMGETQGNALTNFTAVAGSNFYRQTQNTGGTSLFIASVAKDLSAINEQRLTDQPPRNFAIDSEGRINIIGTTQADNITPTPPGLANEGTATGSGYLAQIGTDFNLNFFHRFGQTTNSTVVPESIAIGLNNTIHITGDLNSITPNSFNITGGGFNIGPTTANRAVFFRSHNSDGTLIRSGKFTDTNATVQTEKVNTRTSPRVIYFIGNTNLAQYDTAITGITGPNPNGHVESLIAYTDEDDASTTRKYLARLSEDFSTFENLYKIDPHRSNNEFDFIIQSGKVYLAGIADQPGGSAPYITIDNTTNFINGFTSGQPLPAGTPANVPNPYMAYFSFSDSNFFGQSPIARGFVATTTTTNTTNTRASDTLPTAVLRARITTQDSQETIVRFVDLRSTSPADILSDFLLKSNLTEADLRDINIQDTNGIWIYENGKWRFKRR